MTRPTQEPQAVVVFGASGDLTRRKLIPGLYHLFLEDLLPEPVAIVGYARTAKTRDEFVAEARGAAETFCRCAIEEEPWGRFAQNLSYVAGEFGDAGSFSDLREHLEDLDKRRGTQGRRFFYCATPPEVVPDIVRRIGEEGMAGGARIVIEKPFGSDLASSKELNAIVHEVFDESQIFRIDHYLGKETVQNILVLRFANAFFEPLWNRRYVDHVQLTVAEEIGIEGRGHFYERTGALRDMVQTHLFQVLTFLAMEPPGSFEPEPLRDETLKVLRSMRPIGPADVVRGQYRGYRSEDGVDPNSPVETFVAMTTEVDNWRWAGVPFYLRSGKRLSGRYAEATIVFRGVPHLMFEQMGVDRDLAADHLVIRIQPDEGVSLAFTVRRPGYGVSLDRAALDFDYGETFGTSMVEAYELLLLEAMEGDHTLFTRQDGVERAWEILAPVLEDLPPVIEYEPGSWGPAEAERLIAPRDWHRAERGV
ncbi:MAG: glucose-6-phosphate dehydrogenase [Actinomycetota bacterium]